MFRDLSSAWPNFVLLSLTCYTAYTVKNLNIETEKSAQTLFILSLNIKNFFTMCALKHFKDYNIIWTMQNFCPQVYVHWL